jgi:hypothetical protein
MATYEPVGQLVHNKLAKNLWMVKRTVDVDRQTGASAVGQVDADDVLTAIPVRKGDIVLSTWVQVLTSCTGGASYDLGVGENVDIWADGGPLDGQLVDANTTAPTNPYPYRFSAADTIDVKVLEAAVTAGRFEVCALLIRE